MGYTYNYNPITYVLVFFSIPVTAIIKNAYQFGFSYLVNDSWKFDIVYHYGVSGSATSGNILDPSQISPENPLGAISGLLVSYDMTTPMIQIGINYNFKK